MSDESIAHRLVEAFFTHCDSCRLPADPHCHSRSHWRLYLDLDGATLERLRRWALAPDPHHPVTDAERAILLRRLEARAA
ncbi:hypothetical protein [Kitasatospora aureofaciens]|uniref:hypothetical protein n=1 Tax=Kitasatospora aureofaciens TaxID=1894 RepID=UPI001C461585|nr:hypothetical protein [Kitasatospora aureofaciens]MBV6702113.1 hypothetical protein [Kitasatospora aureofaciens]